MRRRRYYGPAPTNTAPVEPAPPPSTGPSGSLLVADPNYSISSLPSAARTWKQRFNYGRNNDSEAVTYSNRNNTYEIGRNLARHIGALYKDLAVTGDIASLHRADLLMQNTRALLADGNWHVSSPQTYYGQTGTDPDGYLHWLYDVTGNPGEGTDLHWDDVLAYAVAATHMLACHRNASASCTSYTRPSRETTTALKANNPGTYATVRGPALQAKTETTYADRRDFWLWLLRNNYEAKLRERTSNPWPNYGLRQYEEPHTKSGELVTAYAIGVVLRDLGDPDWTVYMNMADTISNEFFTLPYQGPLKQQVGGFQAATYNGKPIYVMGYGTLRGGNTVQTSSQRSHASPWIYARQLFQNCLFLHYDGYAPWTGASWKTRWANNLEELLIGSATTSSYSSGGDQPFARDTVGERTIRLDSGIDMPTNTYRGRPTIWQFIQSGTFQLLPWGGSKLRSHVERIYAVVHGNAEQPSNPCAAICLLMDEAPAR